jgi:hypothetical protein
MNILQFALIAAGVIVVTGVAGGAFVFNAVNEFIAQADRDD